MNHKKINCRIKRVKGIDYDLKIKVWTNSDGNRMFIQTMSSQHLINAINKFDKKVTKNYRDRRWISILKEELEKRNFK